MKKIKKYHLPLLIKHQLFSHPIHMEMIIKRAKIYNYQNTSKNLLHNFTYAYIKWEYISKYINPAA